MITRPLKKNANNATDIGHSLFLGQSFSIPSLAIGQDMKSLQDVLQQQKSLLSYLSNLIMCTNKLNLTLLA